MRLGVKQNGGKKKTSTVKHVAKTQESVKMAAMKKPPRTKDISGISEFTIGDDSNHTYDDRSSSGLIVGFASRDDSSHADDEGGLIVGFGDRSIGKRLTW